MLPFAYRNRSSYDRMSYHLRQVVSTSIQTIALLNQIGERAKDKRVIAERAQL